MASIIKVYEKELSLSGATSYSDVVNIDEHMVAPIFYVSFSAVNTTVCNVNIEYSFDGNVFGVSSNSLQADDGSLALTTLKPGVRTYAGQFPFGFVRFKITLTGGAQTATGKFVILADKKY